MYAKIILNRTWPGLSSRCCYPYIPQLESQGKNQERVAYIEYDQYHWNIITYLFY